MNDFGLRLLGRIMVAMLVGLAILLGILLLVGLALFFAVSFAMAKVLLSPWRMSDGRALFILRRLTPGDLGLPFEDLSFHVQDEAHPGNKIKLTAWWIAAEGPSDKTVIILHGYSDAKVGGIAWAPTFRSMGYHVLALDLRAHGEAEGKNTTAGFYERHDVSQVIDQLRAQRPAQTRTLVLFGVSLGAAVAGATAEFRDDLAAVIMDCPFGDFATAARTHGDAQGTPGPWFQHMALFMAQKLSGADFSSVAPVKVIPKLAVPLMVIHGADDLFVTRAEMDAVEAATGGRRPELGYTEYWRVDDTHHVLALRTDPLEFRRRIEAFLSKALERQPLATVMAS